LADADAVEITWRNYWGSEPTECQIVLNCDDEQFEEIREGISEILNKEDIEAAPMAGDRVALEN
jgi:hypothetical protein